MVKRDVIANFCCFTNHHASPVVYEKTTTDGGAGVDIYIGQRAANERKKTCREAPAG